MTCWRSIRGTSVAGLSGHRGEGVLKTESHRLQGIRSFGNFGFHSRGF